MRECGLKPLLLRLAVSSIVVTPHAGVWIETPLHEAMYGFSWSLPMRECGLKLKGFNFSSSMLMSLPMRECGLKPISKLILSESPLSLPMRECGLKLGESKERHGK